jgi:hypothetical protein
MPAGLFGQKLERMPVKQPGTDPRTNMKEALSKRDSTQKHKVTRQWTLSPDYTTEIAVPLDTAFSQFQHYRKSDKFSDFNIYPGNYGQPLYQLNFFDRIWKPDQFLYSYYKPFMYTPDNLFFVNTQVPFTELVFSYAGVKTNAEQTFHLRHSQNVNKNFNFGFIYDIIYNLGQYKYQSVKNKTFLFHSSYNGDKYTAYFSAGINNLRVLENGGINGENALRDFTVDNVPVNLINSDAKSVLKNRHITLVQRYSLGARKDTASTNVIRSAPVTFSMINSYEWSRKRYFDNDPGNDLYDTIHINKSSTADSLSQGLFSNTFRMDFSTGGTGKFRIGAGVGIRSELRNFGQIMPGDTALAKPDTITTRKGSLVLTGKIFNNIGQKFGWSASGDLWIQGYRAGDFIVNGRIFKDFSTSRGNITWDATGLVASYTPSYWYSSWGANNFLWKFDSNREFRMMVGSSIDYPGRKASVRFNYAIIDNFIYFGSDKNPAQHSGGLSVVSLSLKKEFVVWKFHLDNTVLLQQCSNADVLSLPLAAARSSFFLDHTFHFPASNGELNFQAGGEIFYHTPYYASAYMPATGRYYNQNITETGDYPFVNVFLNLKLKRTRFFIMLDHLNAGRSGYNYFLVPDYPMNIRMMRYGLAWTFYN